MGSKVKNYGYVEAYTILTYAIFVTAAWALALVACVLVVGWNDLTAALREFFGALVPSGPAAALGAAAVHRPFMRAVRDGRAHHAHGWALLGVVAAHVAYVALVFVVALLADGHMHNQSLQHQHWNTALWEAKGMTMLAGTFSLIFGFIPNVVIAQGFAGVMVYLQRQRSARGVQVVQEGGRDAAATFAE